MKRRGIAGRHGIDRWRLSSGSLIYDSNADAAGGVVNLALLALRLASTNADFFVV
jgi:hypothetical protein